MWRKLCGEGTTTFENKLEYEVNITGLSHRAPAALLNGYGQCTNTAEWFAVFASIVSGLWHLRMNQPQSMHAYAAAAGAAAAVTVMLCRVHARSAIWIEQNECHIIAIRSVFAMQTNRRRVFSSYRVSTYLFWQQYIVAAKESIIFIISTAVNQTFQTKLIRIFYLGKRLDCYCSVLVRIVLRMCQMSSVNTNFTVNFGIVLTVHIMICDECAQWKLSLFNMIKEQFNFITDIELCSDHLQVWAVSAASISIFCWFLWRLAIELVC